MSADSTDHPEEIPHAHDQATEVAHAWHHFRENAKFFAGFLSIILLTVFASNIHFDPPWNTVVILVLAALRSGLIAIFLASLFKNFSFVFRTLTFTAIFLFFMILLSMWDSTLPNVGNPITLPKLPPPASHVP